MTYYNNINTVLDSASTQFYSDVLSSKNYTLSSAKITTLNDLSPKAVNPTNATASAGPTIVGNQAGINNQPAMQFGSQVYVRSTTGFPASSYSIFAVHQPVAADFTTGNSAIIGDTATILKGIAYKSTTSGATLAPYNNSGFVGGSNILSFANNPEIVVMTVDALNKTATLYQNGVQTSGPTTFGTFGNDATFQIGNLGNNASTSYNGLIGGIGFCSGVLNPNEVASHSAWLAARFNVKPTFFVMDGDSLTFGQNSTGVFGPYPAQFGNLLSTGLGNNFQILNNGVSGIRLLDMDNNAPTTIDTLKFPAFKKQVILTIFAGTNDFSLDSITPAQCMTRLVNYVTHRAATKKFDRIAVATLIPRTSSGFTDTLFAYNTLVRAAMLPGGSLLAAGATDLIDFAAQTNLNTNTAWNNSTYYNVDATHLTNAGYAILASTAKTAIGF